ncbi:hypothetical protein BH10PSE11_BH10PSE11_08390 [soil metagenome]
MPPSQFPSATENYRRDIDGLRAFAVLSVVIYHAFPGILRGGYVGVDVFFVISGFLISSILLKQLSERRFSLKSFYGRRIRRIFPALIACMFAVLAYGFVVLMPFELAQLGKHVFFGASFLSNIALFSETGYFDGTAALKPLLHLWSLGVEEQFYILWPALLWVAFRIKIPTGKLLVILFGVSFALNISLSMTMPSAAFYLPFTRFWELLAGAALAWWGQTKTTPIAHSALSLAGLTALLTSISIFNSETSFPSWPALLPVAGSMALIFAGPQAIVNRLILSNRLAVFIGLISYPLYIWHWPLISYALIIRMEKALTPLMSSALVAISILLAWITYRFIERPIRFGARPDRGTLNAAVCMMLIGAVGLVVWVGHGFPQRFPLYPNGLDIRKINAAKFDVIYQPTKSMEVIDRETILISHLGHGHRKVALAGDSLLQHYGPRVQQLSDEGLLVANTYFVTLPSCAPLPGIVHASRCYRLTSILTDLVRSEKIQSVVLGAAWTGYGGEKQFVERYGERSPLHTLEGKEAFYANLEDYVRLLQGEGATVYLVLGVPGPDRRFNPSEMVSRSMTGFQINQNFDKPLLTSELRAIHAGVDAKLQGIAERTGAKLLDPFSDVCDNSESCSPVFGSGDPKFSDGMHLRPVFVKDHLHFLDPLLK